MKAKILALLGSIRFWLLVLAAGAEVANVFQPSGEVAKALHIVAGLLVSVAAVGTADRAAEKIGGQA